MVDFGSTDYFHAMDAPKKQIGNMHVKEFGISAKIGDVLQAFKADVATGAKHVELVFAGVGKGSLQGNTNPEMFDKVKREEIRQLAKINGVTVSTHAAVQMAGFSGFNPQRGDSFSETFRQERLQEIKRTIEFAADAAGGGAVVVHTGEFPRTLKDTRFKIGSKEQEPLYLADEKTGKIMGVSRNPLDVPQWKKVNGEYVDIDDKPLKDPRDYAHRVPETDDKGDILWKKGGLQYDDFAKEIKAWNNAHPNQEKRVTEKEFMFLQSFQQIQAEQPRVLEYERGARKMEEDYKELKGKVDTWKELETRTPKDKKEYLLNAFKSEFKELAHELDKTKKNPSQILEEHSNRVKEEAVRLREGYLGFHKNVKKMLNEFETIKPIEEVGLKKTADTFAEAALYAYRLGKQKKLDKAVFIAPENMFADYGYGGHPDELRAIVQESRKAMAEKLEKTFGIKGKEAKKIAEDHIKATFDAGHANTWAKYFEEDQKLSPEENKKKFDTWLVGEVKKLRDDNILGNVHLSDNFGYHDEHLNVGGGNAPLRELVELFKDKRYEGKIVVEWGAQGPEEQQEGGALLAAWANLAGSPIYRVEGVSPRWSDIENVGYFGTSSSPFHVSGAYGAGISKDWRLWSYSEAPIE
ncbi:MAG: TIM barrel protein [bacterium]|nr:TIM barrel protein [bacterium]